MSADAINPRVLHGRLWGDMLVRAPLSDSFSAVPSGKICFREDCSLESVQSCRQGVLRLARELLARAVQRQCVESDCAASHKDVASVLAQASASSSTSSSQAQHPRPGVLARLSLHL